jgi:chemotaxis protein methyltransferase CheR
MIVSEKLSPFWHYQRGLELQEKGAADEAAASFQRALCLDPNLVVAHFALGALFQQQGRWEEAARGFRNARGLLENYSSEALLPGAEGMTAGRMLAVLSSIQNPPP